MLTDVVLESISLQGNSENARSGKFSYLYHYFLLDLYLSDVNYCYRMISIYIFYKLQKNIILLFSINIYPYTFFCHFIQC